MENTIFEQLKKYERPMLTATRAKYYVGISPKDIETLVAIHNQLYPTQKETFTTCNACVLRVLQKLWVKYEEEKNAREKAEKTPETETESPETEVLPNETPAPTATKKRGRPKTK